MAEADAPGPQPHPVRRLAARLLGALAPFFVLLVLLLVMRGAVGDRFFSEFNLKTMPLQASIVAIGAIGMTMIIVAGGIDLSVGSVIALCSVVAAKVLAHHPDAGLWALLAALGVGAWIGSVNGLIIVGGRLPPFIVTLGMLGIARGAAKWLGDNQTVNYERDTWINGLMRISEGREWMVVAPGVWLMLALTAIMMWFMSYTVFGRHLHAIGSNPDAARLCGVRIGRTTILLYAFAGLFFGLAGVLQAARLEQGDPTVAMGLELDVIAAVVIGGASLSGGAGSVLGSVVGAMIMTVLRSGTTQLGWENYTQEIIIGAVIILAVGLDQLRQSGWLSMERLLALLDRSSPGEDGRPGRPGGGGEAAVEEEAAAGR